MKYVSTNFTIHVTLLLNLDMKYSVEQNLFYLQRYLTVSNTYISPSTISNYPDYFQVWKSNSELMSRLFSTSIKPPSPVASPSATLPSNPLSLNSKVSVLVTWQPLSLNSKVSVLVTWQPLSLNSKVSVLVTWQYFVS